MDVYDWIGNAAFLLVACSFVVKDIVWLRWLAIAASVAMVAYAYCVPSGPLWLLIFWNAIFITINAVRIFLLYRLERGVTFSSDEKEVHAILFPDLAAFEFARLLRLGRWVDAAPGTILAHEGATAPDVQLLFTGTAEVAAAGERLAQLGDGAFVGEMSFVSNSPASATVTTKTTARLLSWPQTELKRLARGSPTLRLSLEAAFGADMARKLQRGSPKPNPDG